MGGGDGSIADGSGSWASILAQRGRVLSSDIARGTGLLKVKAEEALWQLVAHGFRYRRRDCRPADSANAGDQTKGAAPTPACHQRRSDGGKNDARGTLVPVARADSRGRGRN